MLMRCLALTLAAMLFCVPVGAETESSPRVSPFSGKPVPRFETLRFTTVNARVGPSFAHRVVWHYERRGLPVLIIKESGDWRRVRDPAGDESWMHARTMQAGETAMILSDTELREAADDSSQIVARLQEGLLVQMQRCDMSFCRVETQNQRGWVPRHALWGIDPARPDMENN
jgi:SH3-like domain-containing protein